MKTLIRLGGCPGWCESSLGAQSLCWFCHEAAHLLDKTVQGSVAETQEILLGYGFVAVQFTSKCVTE